MMLNGSLVLAHIKVWIVSDSQLMVWKAQSGGGGLWQEWLPFEEGCCDA